MTLVIDYGAGNLKSVENALKNLGAEYRIVTSPDQLSPADRLIFPGVGEAASSMAALRKTGLDRGIADFAASGKPFLGICLGSQIILDRSEESDTECLGLISGRVRKFLPVPGLKVPHMGWNNVQFDPSDPIFRDIPAGADFYFVHSYYPAPADPACTLASCEYGVSFSAGLRKENIYAFQFHPEKSGPWGLKLLGNFLGMTKDGIC